MDWLRSYRPDLVDRYDQLYERRAYLPAAERRRLAALVRRSWPEDGRFQRSEDAGTADGEGARPPRGPVPPQALSLF
jgi:hypothetical protein